MPKGNRQAPSLVDLCLDVAIQNVKYLGDVGETEFYLLDRILPHCSVDQLMHVEKSTVGRDLSPVTDKLWKSFFERQFGVKSMNVVIERMKQKKVTFRWQQLYEAKLKDIAEAENKAIARFKQSYQEQVARKQSRQIQLCTKVPPSSSKRNFYGGSGPGCNLKSNILKKAKFECLNSREVKNIAAMKKISVQRSSSLSARMKSGGISGTNSASSSRSTKSLDRRFLSR